jgi:hypothetical protein
MYFYFSIFCSQCEFLGCMSFGLHAIHSQRKVRLVDFIFLLSHFVYYLYFFDRLYVVGTIF